MIAGVVLAAGASGRMGEPKAMLRIGEQTFLQHILQTLRSARVMENVIVLGAHTEQISPTLGWFDGKVAVNARWEQGQLSSLLTAIQSLDIEKLHGIIVCPVDHPLITHSLVVELLKGFWQSNKNIIIPTFGGKRGHPVIFGSPVIDALRSAPPGEGAKAVVHSMPEEILEVPVNEEGILFNIDTPEDYKNLIMNH